MGVTFGIMRAIVIVLDGVGAGAAPDSAEYGDTGTNSLAHTALAVGGLHLPNMSGLGLGSITEIKGLAREPSQPSGHGKMRPQSPGKDTVSGHWELMGIRLEKPLPTYPCGFPDEVVNRFSELVGRGIIGNKAASGTEIIQELGEEHIRTGKLILYTSADSVFQVAAHENFVPIAELHRYCEIARQLLQGEHAIGRVIARPFLGDQAGKFFRTENRRDYPLPPPGRTIMDRLVAAGKDVITVGKLDDIFARQGITRSAHTLNNQGSIAALLEFLSADFDGLLFVNLIEFDMIYGHRRDPKGYATALEEFDRHLPEISRRMDVDDLAMIVSDHGVDPTAPGSDHTREFVPLLAFSKRMVRIVDLGIRETLGDVAATLAEYFKLEPGLLGRSFLGALLGSVRRAAAEPIR
jgi:phosphopentomutase